MSSTSPTAPTATQQPSSQMGIGMGKQVINHINQGKNRGKYLGKGPKRHHKVVKDPLLGITKPSIRRLLRRGGVKRISATIYEEIRGISGQVLENILKDAMCYTEHAHRKTVTVMDIIYAMKRQGKALYGFDDGKKGKDFIAGDKKKNK